MKEFFKGYVEICEYDGYTYFYRFSEKQRLIYEGMSDWFGKMSRCSAGIRIEAEECGYIEFEYAAEEDFVFDMVHDNLCEHIGCRKNGNIKLNCHGENIKIFFPYDIPVGVRNVNVCGKYPKKKPIVYCFGDSITQGYYSEYSSVTYPNILCRSMAVDTYNFGIGGMYFDVKALADISLLSVPEFVIVAYGTNDWKFETGLKEKMPEMLRALAEKYVKNRIFVLLPSARDGENEIKRDGTLQTVREMIAAECAKYNNFVVLNSGNKIDVKTQLQDGLHPNSIGMEIYGKCIAEDVKRFVNTNI